MRTLVLAVLLAGCGAPATPAPAPTTTEPTSDERVCFTGTIDNGVCHLFSAAHEPLSVVAQQCRMSGVQWLAACPGDGRLGLCTGPDGDRAVYYGLGIGRDAAQHACEADGRSFTP